MGDLVRVRRLQVSGNSGKKFANHFIGPFSVVERLSATTYLVEDTPINQCRRRWRVFPAHTAQLLLYSLYRPKQILEMEGNEENRE